MDKAKMMFSVAAAQAMVAAENKRQKQLILGHAICLGVISLIFTALYFNRLASADNMQKQAKDALNPLEKDSIIYDIGCYTGPWSDD